MKTVIVIFYSVLLYNQQWSWTNFFFFVLLLWFIFQQIFRTTHFWKTWVFLLLLGKTSKHAVILKSRSLLCFCLVPLVVFPFVLHLTTLSPACLISKAGKVTGALLPSDTSISRRPGKPTWRRRREKSPWRGVPAIIELPRSALVVCLSH